MNRWTLGGVVAVCVAFGVYFVVAKREPAAPPAGQPVVAARPPVPPAAPPAPVVLAEVIDVANIDPLLDPPARPVTGAPFDADPPAAPLAAPASIFIPPAVDDALPEIAPMPREAIAAPLGIGFYF